MRIAGRNNRLVTLDIEDVDGGDQSEPSGRQTHAAEHVEADPDAPGKLVGEIGGAAEAEDKAEERGISARRPSAETKMAVQNVGAETRVMTCASVSRPAQLRSRRWVSQKIPPSRTRPRRRYRGSVFSTCHGSGGKGVLRQIDV